MGRNGRSVDWWLFFFIPALLVLSCYLIFKTVVNESVAEQPQPLTKTFYTVETARGATLKNKSIVGNCHICHAYWVPIPRNNQTSNPRFAHADIQLDHGNNNRCYNCHLITDRNKYAANDGSPIMTELPEKLCARCHGLIYNDWQIGTHGKWTGMWRPVEKRDRTTFTCTECHDPHSPKFRYDIIAPPPVWPQKYLRTQLEHGPAGPSSQFLVNEEPKEIF